MSCWPSILQEYIIVLGKKYYGDTPHVLGCCINVMLFFGDRVLLCRSGSGLTPAESLEL
jgi:hypothetical protein